MELHEVKNGNFTIPWKGKEHPRTANWNKAASSSTAPASATQLVLEHACILHCSTNILQQSLFVWLFSSSTEDMFVVPLCAWWCVLGQGPSMLSKVVGQLMFKYQHWQLSNALEEGSDEEKEACRVIMDSGRVLLGKLT